MRKRLFVYAALGVLIAGSVAATAQADEVTDWNQTMLRSGLLAGSSALVMSRVAAIVQASVFDAVNGIDRKYTPIHVTPAGPAGASRRAAAVQAAYIALIRLFPAQQTTLDARRKVAMAVIGVDNGADVPGGVAWGASVANQIVDWRLTDGTGTTSPTWPGNTALGQWRPTPNAPAAGTSANGAGYPQYAVGTTTWAIASASQFRPAAPPALDSPRYAQDFNETKTMGSFSSTARTPDQTIASLFWATGTASYLWNHVALSLIEAKTDNDDHEGESHRGGRNSLLNNARILAELDVAMADAALGCWDAKYAYNYWRPITAIRETADDGNAATTPDTAWTPLFATPAHPEYPSGHSCVSGAAAAILASEFGEKTRFRMENDLMIGVTRPFKTFSSALEEVKDARIFSGIHFRTATEVGTALGASVADYILDHAFQRTH